jgi:hypothetical protein
MTLTYMLEFPGMKIDSGYTSKFNGFEITHVIYVPIFEGLFNRTL